MTVFSFFMNFSGIGIGLVIFEKHKGPHVPKKLVENGGKFFLEIIEERIQNQILVRVDGAIVYFWEHIFGPPP